MPDTKEPTYAELCVGTSLEQARLKSAFIRDHGRAKFEEIVTRHVAERELAKAAAKITGKGKK